MTERVTTQMSPLFEQDDLVGVRFRWTKDGIHRDHLLPDGSWFSSVIPCAVFTLKLEASKVTGYEIETDIIAVRSAARRRKK